MSGLGSTIAILKQIRDGGGGGGLTAKGFQKLAVNAAVAFTVPSGATRAEARCETADVRYRDDGVDPTATDGMLLKVGEVLVYDAGAIATVRFIKAGATNGQLSILYYG